MSRDAAFRLGLVGRCLCLASVLIVVASFAATTCAQTADSRLYDSGTQPWLVVKASLSDFTGKEDRIIADFPTKEAAKEVAKRLDQAEKEWWKWTYLVRERKRLDQTGGPGPTAQGSSASGLPSAATGRTPQVPGKRAITVKVYKLVDGNWVEQPDRDYETTSDYRGASKYYMEMNATGGWKATWNAPGWPRPLGERPKLLYADVKPYNPPAESGGTQATSPPAESAGTQATGTPAASYRAYTIREVEGSGVFDTQRKKSYVGAATPDLDKAIGAARFEWELSRRLGGNCVEAGVEDANGRGVFRLP